MVANLKYFAEFLEIVRCKKGFPCVQSFAQDTLKLKSTADLLCSLQNLF